jgi:3-hydroxyisobutyrate dehydrogenase-like beta-hydroxyacid dehydrogenase
MGAEMAGRLLDDGVDLAVHNRTRAKTEPLRARGALVVDAPADLADRDVVFTMVSGSDDLLSVTTGEAGVLRGGPARPRILVDCSTVSADASAVVRGAAATQGTAMLAAPVSGNPGAVRRGQAAVVASGPQAAFDAAAGLLACLGRSVTYVGDGEAARMVKIAHNLMLGIVTQALAETTVLTEMAGVPRGRFLEFLNASVMGSDFTRYKTPALVELDFTPTFTPQLLRKDLDLGVDAAAAHGIHLPLTSATRARVQALLDDGLVDVDFAALLLLQAKDAGLTLHAEDSASPSPAGRGRHGGA